jgi:BirA family biotin operon repressor/biotin-[acetyl-CoA-carboxylase] ligase
MRGSTLTGIIIGCGINVNQRKFPNLPCATSMALCAEKKFSIEEMFETLANKIKTELTSKTDAHEAYMSLLFGFQEELTFKRPDGTTFEATITDVAQNGTLLLTHKNGRKEAFNEKEVIFKVSANCQ